MVDVLVAGRELLLISGIPLQQNKSHKGCGWNSLPLEVKSSPSLNIFKSKLKTHLFKCTFNLN